MRRRQGGTRKLVCTGSTTASRRTLLRTFRRLIRCVCVGSILTEDVMVALEAVVVWTAGAACPDRPYTGLRQHCVLYTDSTRALYRTRAELLAQTRRELKSAVRADKIGGKLAATGHTGGQGPQNTLAAAGHRGSWIRTSLNVRSVSMTARRKAERHRLGGGVEPMCTNGNAHTTETSGGDRGGPP